MSDEKRRFSRVTFLVRAEMTVNNILYSAENINNISIGGCLLPIKMDVETGTKCSLEIFLSGTNSNLSISLEGEIIRCESGTVAIKFIEVEPDSLFHLQNIIRYNYPDTEKVEQEISNPHGNGEKG